MNAGSNGRLFPLYLSPFESFMRTDDRPGHPMNFYIIMRFSGRVERPAFERALDTALKRHPLLQCLVEPGKRNRLSWVPHPELRPWVDWGTQEEPLERPAREQIDLSRELGLRVWIRQAAEQVEFVFEFHHACCDGIGAHRFLGDLFASYGIQTAGLERKPDLIDLDAGRLRRRGDRLRLLSAGGVQRWTGWAAARYAFRFGGLQARPLQPARSATQVSMPFPGVYSRSLQREEHQWLRAAAVEAGVTLNDVFVGQLFHAIAQWNGRYPLTRPWRKLRILLPVDLRGRDDEVMPAANLVSYSFLDRRPADCGDVKRLVRSIREETGSIKDQGLGNAFLDTITRGASIRGLLPLCLAGHRCMATAVFTSVGDPTRRYTARFPRRNGKLLCGNLTLEEITGSSPLRPETRAAFSVTTYLRQITVGLRCDPQRFCPASAQQLLDLYVQGLREWIRD